MITLKHKVDEAIVLTVDGKEIIITLHDVSEGAAQLVIKADEDVNISHKVMQDEYMD